MHQIVLLLTFFVSLFSGLSFFVYFPVSHFFQSKMIGLRTVAVRGLASRVLQADSGNFSFALSLNGSDSDLVKQEILKKQQLIIDWLVKKGIPSDEVNLYFSRKDNHQEIWRSAMTEYSYSSNKNERDTKMEAAKMLVEKTPRYTFKVSFSFESNDVFLLKKIPGDLASFAAAQDFFFDSVEGPNYFLKEFPKIRNEMLDEANNNAFTIAERSTKSLGGKLGKFLGFSQGYFTISHPDDEDGESSYSRQLGSIYKKIRVVTKAEYLCS